MSIYREAPHAPTPPPRCPRDGCYLNAHTVESTVLHVCARCSGVWIDLESLVGLLGDPMQMDGMALHPVATPASGRPADNVRLLPCVRCGKESERRAYGDDARIQVDTCEQHGIWLDGGELNAILRHARVAEPLPGDAVGARRAALRGTQRRGRRKPLPKPPRDFDADAELVADFIDGLRRLWFLSK
jgi:Zn-finger nucleic acid-binding protein